MYNNPSITVNPHNADITPDECTNSRPSLVNFDREMCRFGSTLIRWQINNLWWLPMRSIKNNGQNGYFDILIFSVCSPVTKM
jgi:hypothetical protein